MLICMLATMVAMVSIGQVVNPVVTFDVWQRGTFEMELNMKEAPRTAGHIKMLVEKGFYDGILFHRKVKGFVVQTGDPTSKNWTSEEARLKPGAMGGTDGLGEGTYGKPIKFEKNKLSHVKGTVGIALSSPGDDSGDSQLFINLEDNTRLDGKYVVFAKIVSGWDTVEKVRRGDLIRSAKIK